MGGKKKNKKKKTKAQEAATARHAKFKQTKVQTFGGKRSSFSSSEEKRIKDAGYSVSGYSKAAPNKASGYSGTTGVSVGSKIKNPNPKSTGVGPVADGSEYASMLKASPPRFNELGRNEVNQNIAFNPLKILRNNPDTEIPVFSGGKIQGGQNRVLEMHNFERELKGLPPVKSLPDQSSLNQTTGKGTLIASTSPMAIQTYGTGGITEDASSASGFSRDGEPLTKTEAMNTFGIGGLNLNNIGGTDRAVTSETSEQRADNYKSTLNPDSFKGLSDGETRGSGPVASGEDYARGLNVDNKNVENIMRSAYNAIPFVPNVRRLTDKEIADNRISAQNKSAYRKEMAKFRGGASGGNRLPVTPTVFEEVAPQYQPIASASTTPTTQTGVDSNRLLQIQQQAYAQAYNPMLIGGFNPQFRFGATTPNIDYSTYFNY